MNVPRWFLIHRQSILLTKLLINFPGTHVARILSIYFFPNYFTQTCHFRTILPSHRYRTTTSRRSGCKQNYLSNCQVGLPLPLALCLLFLAAIKPQEKK